MTLQAALTEGARAFADRPWICDEERTWSYAEGDRIIDRLARGLMAAGVEPGDRVALLFGNSPELVFSYYACFKIGAIAVPLNVRFAPPELAYALGHCGARMLLGSDRLCQAVMPLRSELPALSAVHVAGDLGAVDGARPFDALLADDGAAEALPAVDDQQVAVLLYTSGTTARPKGVIHTHAGLQQQALNLFDALGQDMYERTVVTMPMFHIGGFSGLLVTTTQAGGSLWIPRGFDPEQVLQLMQQSRATFSGCLPHQARMLANCPAATGVDLSSLKAFVCGGDYVQAELQSRFRALFGVPLDEICGMTELYYTIQPLRRGARKPGTIGKPIGDVRIALLNGEGEAVAEGEVGEIVVQSAALTLGYWNDETSTATALRDGWFWTGDLGSRDCDGFYRFEGRRKDLIIRGGSNISPGEVEDVLAAHPAVAEVGIVGAPDAELGQVVWAYVALNADAEAGAAELDAWAGERIAAYKVPERIVFLDALPKGLTGKVDRKTLRAWATAERETARAPA